MNEVCQPGVGEWDLPSWCVGYSLSIDTILQLVIEIFILLLVFSTCYAYFDWKRKKKLEKEIGGILRWCVEGAKRVIANKYRLTEPESVKLMSEKFQKEQSSALTFIDEECEVTGRQGDYIIKARLYDDYSNWCTQTGRHKKNDSNFFKDIKNVFREEVDTDSKKRVEKRLLRAVTGIKKVTGYEGTKM